MSELETVRGLARGALDALEQSRERIDDLNVYPVPDGDTGTNLTLTARGVVEALDASTATDRHDARARGDAGRADVGARGNSGVILSQIVRGAADVAGASPTTLAARVPGRQRRGLRGGAQAGRGDDADRDPRAGRGGGGGAAARAGRSCSRARRARGGGGRAHAASSSTCCARPGVVDAGGAGLVELVRGSRRRGCRRGCPSAPADDAQAARSRRCTRSSRATATARPSSSRARASTRTRSSAELERLGDSLLVVGDPSALKVHVHTDDPGAALSLGHARRDDRGRRDRGHAPPDRGARGAAARRRCRAAPRARRVVAVVAGEGNRAPVRGPRRRADRRGRPDDEPVHRRPARSDRGDRRATRSCCCRTTRTSSSPPSRPRAWRASRCTSCRRRSIPAGLAALVAFHNERSADENAAAMREALAGVVDRRDHGRLARRHGRRRPGARGRVPRRCWTATRSPRAPSFDEVARALLERLLAEPRDVLTLLRGEDAPPLNGAARRARRAASRARAGRARRRPAALPAAPLRRVVSIR